MRSTIVFKIKKVGKSVPKMLIFVILRLLVACNFFILLGPQKVVRAQLNGPPLISCGV